jgi:hypothetical protein
MVVVLDFAKWVLLRREYVSGLTLATSAEVI